MNNELRTQLLSLATKWKQSAQSKKNTAEKLYSKTGKEPHEFFYRGLHLAANEQLNCAMAIIRVAEENDKND